MLADTQQTLEQTIDRINKDVGPYSMKISSVLSEDTGEKIWALA